MCCTHLVFLHCNGEAKRVCWHENSEIVQIFPSAGFVWLLYEYLYKTSCCCYFIVVFFVFFFFSLLSFLMCVCVVVAAAAVGVVVVVVVVVVIASNLNFSGRSNAGSLFTNRKQKTIGS